MRRAPCPRESHVTRVTRDATCTLKISHGTNGLDGRPEWLDHEASHQATAVCRQYGR